MNIPQETPETLRVTSRVMIRVSKSERNEMCKAFSFVHFRPDILLKCIQKNQKADAKWEIGPSVRWGFTTQMTQHRFPEIIPDTRTQAKNMSYYLKYFQQMFV